jgi:hypothetical protein
MTSCSSGSSLVMEMSKTCVAHPRSHVTVTCRAVVRVNIHQTARTRPPIYITSTSTDTAITIIISHTIRPYLLHAR